MNYQTTQQLAEMRLHSMRYEYQRQSELPAMEELSFDDRFSMIVNEQYVAKANAKVKRLIKNAKLRDESACLENLDYEASRNLKKASVASLSDCLWVTEGTNMIITGPTGVGKTYLLSAFGREACIKGLTVKCFRTTRLLTDLSIAKWSMNCLSAQANFNELPMVSIWNKAKNFSGIEYNGKYPVKEVMDYLCNNGYANEITLWMGKNSQKAEYVRSYGNIANCWMSLIAFSILFIVIATLFLKRVDKDKR